MFIDFEEILTGIEQMPPYQVLLDVVKRGHTQTPLEKTFLGCFVFLQLLRSHAIMNSMIELHAQAGLSKFEHFIKLKWMLESREALYSVVQPIVACRWTIFRADTDAFPLCDSPVLIRPRPHDIMVPLSPRLLLQIQPPIRAHEDELPIYRKITPHKFKEFRHRVIGNTFREIIFGDRAVLEHWQATDEFRNRVALLKQTTNYNSLVHEDHSAELWKINSYGNM